MLAPILATLILLGYLVSLWWLLRRESAAALMGVAAALSAIALCLRLMYLREFPPGLDSDEALVLARAANLLNSNDLFAEELLLPLLLSVLFQAQLIPLFGVGFWAIRLYPLVTGVLAVPAAFAAGRALGLRVASGLAACALVAVLPWSIFYSRVTFGGELVFHELLLLAALARLIWAAGGWAETALGGFALCLLLYDYYCGRMMLVFPPLVAILARGRRRALCVTIPLVALLGFVPHLATEPPNIRGGPLAERLQPLEVVRTAPARLAQTLATLTSPTAGVGAFSPSTAAMHPALALALAALGAVTAGRARLLFLIGGFVVGLVPALLGSLQASNAHRMLMAFPFIALAAGSVFDRIGRRRTRLAVTVVAVVVIGAQSVRFYFSQGFWPPGSTDGTGFDPDRSELIEAIPPPPHPPLFVLPSMGSFLEMLSLKSPGYELLNVENWLPPERGSAMYAFDVYGGVSLRVFYEDLFGPTRVRAFGSGFLVTLEDGDWSWVRQHGWAYERRCGAEVQSAQVPTLHHPFLTFRELRCAEPEAIHVWRGRWLGPAARVRLQFSGVATVETPRGRLVDKTGRETSADFALEPNTDVTVSLTVRPAEGALWAALLEVTPPGERLPHWESVSPSFPDRPLSQSERAR